MRLTLVIYSLDCGGSQRVLSLLANAWAGQGHSVRILTLARAARPFFPLDPSVAVEALDVARPAPHFLAGLANNLRRVLALRRALARHRAEVVLAFIDTANVLALLAGRSLGVPMVISERGYPPASEAGPVWRLLRRVTYPLAGKAGLGGVFG